MSTIKVTTLQTSAGGAVTFNDGTITALATNSIQVGTAYGSSGSSNGSTSDNSKVWLTAIGDLA